MKFESLKEYTAEMFPFSLRRPNIVAITVKSQSDFDVLIVNHLGKREFESGTKISKQNVLNEARNTTHFSVNNIALKDGEFGVLVHNKSEVNIDFEIDISLGVLEPA